MSVETNNLKKEDLIKFIDDKYKVKTLKELKKMVKNIQNSFWCLNPTRSLNQDVLYITLYKDLTGCGYDKLYNAIKDWCPFHIKSLQHNVKEMRKHLYEWGNSQIISGTLSDWKSSMRNIKLENCISDGNLFIDSVDFKKWSKGGLSTKSTEYSYKKKSYASRFQYIMDGKTRIRGLYGPFSPKQHDSDFLQAKKELLDKKFEDGTFFADCHYSKGRKLFTKLNFHVPLGDNETKLPTKYSKLIRNNKKSSKEYGDMIRKVRSRVERPFGNLKIKYNSLSNKFKEGDDELKNLVIYTAGIHNYELK
jgi:hypothetical protein